MHALRYRKNVGLFHLRQLGQAEVQDFHFALLVDDDVGGLQVAMHDTGVVSGGQPIGDLDGVAQRLIQPDAFAADQAVQRLAGHVLHGDEIHRLPVHLPGVDVENGDDVAIAQGRRGFGLLREARAAIGIGDGGGRQHFDGDGAIQMGVECAIDHAHPSSAQLGFDAIVPESFAYHGQNSSVSDFTVRAFILPSLYWNA